MNAVTISNYNGDSLTLANSKGVAASLYKSVALASLKELAVSLAFAAVTCAFVATPVGVATLLATAVAVVAINTLIRSFSVSLILELRQNPQSTSAKERLKFLNYLAPLNFSYLDLTTRDVLIHEAGHAGAAALLFKDAKPKIEIIPLKGGLTHWTHSALSKLGHFLGEKNVDLVVTAAGPAAVACTSTLLIALAHKLKKSHPTLSRYFLVSGIVSIANLMFYALSALFSAYRTPGHDFVFLWARGIHPIASAVTIVALPLLVKLGLLFFDRFVFHHNRK